MKLKQYQADTLAVLRRFLEEARIAGPKNAYEAITNMGADHQEAVTAFQEKRKPKFKGR